MSSPRSAFSFIELLVVVAVIAVLVTMGTNSLISTSKKSRDATRKSDLSQIKQALVLYHANYGVFPKEEGAITSITSGLPNFSTYLKALPSPPLISNGENDYYYKCHQEGYGGKCTQFSLCTGGLSQNNDIGLEFVGSGLGNATQKSGEGALVFGGICSPASITDPSCNHYCVFGP
jgi:prepilin-type N-terminal cleavage/methylation domain-containing protein